MEGDPITKGIGKDPDQGYQAVGPQPEHRQPRPPPQRYGKGRGQGTGNVPAQLQINGFIGNPHAHTEIETVQKNKKGQGKAQGGKERTKFFQHKNKTPVNGYVKKERPKQILNRY